MIFWLIKRTHYDLAWWATWKVFQARFSIAMDEVVPALESDPSDRFTLDGQAILARWWIESASTREEAQQRHLRLKHLARNGQLQLGPNYVLHDEILAPQETSIMNLQYGREDLDDLDAPNSISADMSDVFGHIAQLAQILKSFGLHAVFFSRGFGPELRKLAPLVRLASPDGSEVTAVVQLGSLGYRNGQRLGAPLPVALWSALWHLARYGKAYRRIGLRGMPFFVGGDHTGLKHRVTRNARFLSWIPGFSVKIVTNDEFVAALRTTQLPRVKGRRERSGQMPLLRDVNSTRMPLKQINERVERLINSAQAAWVLASRRSGVAYPEVEFGVIWRSFLVIQSHDAITGCHVDEVTADIIAEYEIIERTAHKLLDEALAILTPSLSAAEHETSIGLWNPLPYKSSRVQRVTLPDALHGDFPLTATVKGLRVPVQRLTEDSAAVSVTLSPFGSVSIRLGRAQGETDKSEVAVSTIDNDLARVTVDTNGTYTFTDHARKRSVTGLGRFESVGEKGDTYTHDAVGKLYDSRCIPAKVRCTLNGPLVWELQIHQELLLPQKLVGREDPAWLTNITTAGKFLGPRLHLPFLVRTASNRRRSDTLVACNVVTVLRLHAGSSAVDCETTVDNQAKDHKLQLVFPLGRTVQSSRALSVFNIEDYDVLPRTKIRWQTKSTAPEPPFNNHAHLGFASAGYITMMTRGLPDYEARQGEEGTELCPTLLRSVGELARSDLSKRLGPAGPLHLLTPRAQCQGSHTFEYSLSLNGDAGQVELVRKSQIWRYGFIQTSPGIDTNAMLVPGGRGWMYSALTTTGKSPVLRVFAGNEPASMNIPGIRAGRIELNGTAFLGDYPELNPHQIATFQLD